MKQQKIKSQIRCVWTWPDHFTHYMGGGDHQLCLTANGWKARILGFIFRAKDKY